MARALLNGKILFAALSDGIVLSGRGFSSSAAAASSSGKRMMEEKTATPDTGVAISWVPDPVTGYYRPANHLREADPAELRQIFLRNKA